MSKHTRGCCSLNFGLCYLQGVRILPGMKDSNADDSTPNKEINLTITVEFLGFKNAVELPVASIGSMILFVTHSLGFIT